MIKSRAIVRVLFTGSFQPVLTTGGYVRKKMVLIFRYLTEAHPEAIFAETHLYANSK